MSNQAAIPKSDSEDGSLSTLSSDDSHPQAQNTTPAPSSPPASPTPTRESSRDATKAPPSPPTLVQSSPNAAYCTRLSPASNRVTFVRIAVDMRTRSSRLFFVLLHLVGVSTNIPSSGPSSSGSYGSSGGSSSPGIFSFIRKHRPSWLTWSAGIVGVHPTAILLERLDVQSSRRGLAGIVERVERAWGWDGDDVLGEPYWFQDSGDGRCLGPDGGFGECGDATLWRVRRKPLTRRQSREKRYKMRRRQRLQTKEESVKLHQTRNPTQGHSPSVCVWPFFCEEGQAIQPTEVDYDEVFGFEYENNDEQDEGFAIQLMDINVVMNLKDGSARRRNKRRLFWNFRDPDEDAVDPQAECLLSLPSSGEGSTLQIGSCSSAEAWLWHVNRDGILVRGSTKAEKRRRRRRWRIAPRKASAAAAAAGGGGRLQPGQTDFGCVRRSSDTSAMLLPCDSDGMGRAEEDSSIVGFSLVRYPSSPRMRIPRRKRLLDDRDADTEHWEPWRTLEGQQEQLDDSLGQTADASKSAEGDVHLPSSRTNSQHHASTGAKHRKVDLKSTASMLHMGLDQGKARKDATTSASHIRDAPVAINGVAFHNQLSNKAGDDNNEMPSTRPSSTKLRLDKKDRRKGRAGGQTPIHEDPSDGGPDSAPHRPRKIPVHPYIQSSKDFVWVDPLTSLEYPTDLCDYLGHEKKEVGRHTLMGVGQYYRTAFNIKVYGAALYVAKRDVLADPTFGQYATLSAEELRSRDDFYELLMNMPAEGEDPANSLGGFFDRTLFIKINMQLSTDAMRKSLEADWSLLTEEMKSLIIESSFKERMADERMQKKIASKENSSNCSCGQTAPPELGADPSCCARGTELVFTWRKNGDFEIRLDGRVMDVFPRPDIATGIFSEYMNNDPISLDAKAHFTDGFPFLLAPLAQVKGMSSAVPQIHEPAKKMKSSSHNPMHRLMDAAVNSMGAMNNQAHSLSKWMQDSAADMSASAMGSAMGVARGLSEELDKQRMDFFDAAMSFQKEGMEMLSSLIKLSAEDDELALAIVNQAMPSLSPFSSGFDTYNRREKPPEIIPDEIGIRIEPTMNLSHQLFFLTVHIYLLLMFVVSMPGSKNNRWVVKRRILETKAFVQSQSRGAFAAMSKLH